MLYQWANEENEIMTKTVKWIQVNLIIQFKAAAKKNSLLITRVDHLAYWRSKVALSNENKDLTALTCIHPAPSMLQRNE